MVPSIRQIEATNALVAAVSDAGGLGILATGPLQPEDTRHAIEAVRKRTDRPFGIGVTLMMPGAVEGIGRISGRFRRTDVR